MFMYLARQKSTGLNLVFTGPSLPVPIRATWAGVGQKRA